MSETDGKEIKSETISDRKDESIKAKLCNKFSIENILGLNDDVKVNRFEYCQKDPSSLNPVRVYDSNFINHELPSHPQTPSIFCRNWMELNANFGLQGIIE
ncbi:CLUMA_CG004312, isoform A [Clunio marinus]|uniref:CLUMA_CG004312, isoform A n=1 Tax=Clunio marinus TaxID=568069 RepID=A0A1J1HST7_9DIPT|nr:CLUMA_CG004312, isoform A [Clunio marinus]